ncbi:isovaleryl-CoA dehydrogenase [Jeongeupia naejangsanensis]|uniref:Isovaleryl-CoA dehydrogenase n=1 Tax=Jeongeupia naejangsanensis TaxID=613195 RepID=A0ABS2BFB4_9NEIS|nr:isovaleryl-CoA dehydrogenase [Jeongeupia naejangsanensis]MBM3114299.1 isovaleryl-CoA dehydrogenase [Jeongeupia naejangsanensis]
MPGNLVPRLVEVDVYGGDAALQMAVHAFAASWVGRSLHQRGRMLYAEAWLDAAEIANLNSPQLFQYDRIGQRVDEIVFDPAWHALLGNAVAARLHNAPWAAPRPGAAVARAAGFYLQAQLEAGSLCPVTMTHAAIPLLLQQPTLRQWHVPLLSSCYDPRPLHGSTKRGVLVGMGMTEKQGGSDLRRNETRAEPEGESVRLYGHKWFFSAPQADAHLVLAQGPAGLGCYFMPRCLDDDRPNAIRYLRLKDKLGNCSNASAEVEFDGALAYPVGESGRGIATLLMVAARTRLDCALASAGLMRMALMEAIHSARHRHAFGGRLVDASLMQAVLADMAVESEASMWLAMRLAHASDGQTTEESLLYRLLTPVAKFWICKRTEMLIAEAMEVLGGNGYCEGFRLARAYREAPVNSIWEGAGNVMCLDVLRTLQRQPEAVEMLLAELAKVRGQEQTYDVMLDSLPKYLRHACEATARQLTGCLAQLMQAALLLQYANPDVASAFVQGQLSSGGAGGVFGAAWSGKDASAVLLHAWPE